MRNRLPSRHPGLRRLSAAALLLAGCAMENTTPDDPDPPAPSERVWSDPRSWAGAGVPLAGAEVVIREGTNLILDVSPPALRSLTVLGSLTFANADLNLTAGWIMVHGTFRIGTEAEPYRHKAVITLDGPGTDNVMGMGARVLGVQGGGALELHGEPRTSWTTLDASAAVGATQITLAKATNWRVGDRIAIASTDFNPLWADDAVITAVSGRNLTLATPLKYAHWGTVQTISGKTVDERAEVGLLTRNIVIQGDPVTSPSGLGGHLMVMRGGTAHIEGADRHRCPVSDPLAHGRCGGRPVCPGQFHLEDPEPLRHHPWHRQPRRDRQCLLRPPRPRLLPRGWLGVGEHRRAEPGNGVADAGGGVSDPGLGRDPGHLLDHQSCQPLRGQRGGGVAGARVLGGAAGGADRALDGSTRSADLHPAGRVPGQCVPFQQPRRAARGPGAAARWHHHYHLLPATAGSQRQLSGGGGAVPELHRLEERQSRGLASGYRAPDAGGALCRQQDRRDLRQQPDLGRGRDLHRADRQHGRDADCDQLPDPRLRVLRRDGGGPAGDVHKLSHRRWADHERHRVQPEQCLCAEPVQQRRAGHLHQCQPGVHREPATQPGWRQGGGLPRCRRVGDGVARPCGGGKQSVACKRELCVPGRVECLRLQQPVHPVAGAWDQWRGDRAGSGEARRRGPGDLCRERERPGADPGLGTAGARLPGHTGWCAAALTAVLCDGDGGWRVDPGDDSVHRGHSQGEPRLQHDGVPAGGGIAGGAGREHGEQVLPRHGHRPPPPQAAGAGRAGLRSGVCGAVGRDRGPELSHAPHDVLRGVLYSGERNWEHRELAAVPFP
ncbi:MAG: hypothetical protein KJZ47_02545 [Gemmatimonadales bacterium]|nr:hypothetical protein [Gemmatimonadales bacterium]